MLKTCSLLLLLSMISTPEVIACMHSQNSGGLLPHNDLYIGVDEKNHKAGGLNHSQYNNIVDKIAAIYEPIIVSLGKKLEVAKLWSSGEVNAYADQVGDTWKIEMHGGLARHEAITLDSFALVICHEFGHHLAGFPKKIRNGRPSWSSAEGQADYFANTKCLRKYFRTQDNLHIVKKLKIPLKVKLLCQEQFSEQIDQLICQRASIAGQQTAVLMGMIMGETSSPGFASTDKKKVVRNYTRHSKSQCRLDTYFSGSLCQVSENQDFDNEDENINACTIKNGFNTGIRPKCWFAPST